MSPWDLVPIDEDRKPNSVGHVPVLPSEIVGTLYRPRPGDWGDERDSECNRISASLSQVMELAESEPFVSTNDLGLLANLCPYPMDLCTIKARLDNQFYRRASAVEFDVNYIVTNAVKFHHPKSNIVRSASVITDLCLEIIRNGDAVDVPAIYQQILEKYREERGDENADGPGTSEAASTSTTRTRSRRLTTTHSHQGPSGSRNPQPSKTRQSIRPVPSPPNPVSASSGVQSAASSPNDGHKSPDSGSICSGNPTPESQGRGESSLPYTLKLINGKKNFECNFCTKTFSWLRDLNRHVRTHTGERPFKCKVCKKRFALLGNLKGHLRIHTGERPFSCQVCGKNFSSSSRLKTHMRLHTGEKPFACDICQKRFSRTDHLKLHKQRQHNNERSFKCGGCQKKYVSATELRRHWKTSNCQPNSVEKPLSPIESNDSDVEGIYYL